MNALGSTQRDSQHSYITFSIAGNRSIPNIIDFIKRVQ